MENIHEGHRQRLKNQFMDNGISSLLPHQILEMLLFYAIPRSDTNETAHELISKFGSIAGVFNATRDELVKVKGVSDNVVVLLKLIPQLLSVYSSENVKDKPLTDLATIYEYFASSFLGVMTEQIKLCCLDDNLKVVTCPVIQDGAVNVVPVNVRKLVETVYKSNCSLIILAHNHPNGMAVPSDEDIKVTRQLKQILASVGINLLDHVIVGKSGAISMKYSGYFNTFD